MTKKLNSLFSTAAKKEKRKPDRGTSSNITQQQLHRTKASPVLCSPDNIVERYDTLEVTNSIGVIQNLAHPYELRINNSNLHKTQVVVKRKVCLTKRRPVILGITPVPHHTQNSPVRPYTIRQQERTSIVVSTGATGCAPMNALVHGCLSGQAMQSASAVWSPPDRLRGGLR